MIDSVFRIGKNCYSQVFLEEYKYVTKEKKMPKYRTNVTEIFSDVSGKEDSNEESSDNSDKENSNGSNVK